jgi:microsomal epoxide hydrolase
MQKVPKPYRLAIPDAALTDLKERLARTRWPDEPPLEAWSTGTSLAYMQDLVRYWQDGFDWRAAQAKLNAFPQYTARVKGIDLHFIHAPGKRPGAPPLLLSHGWPGSVFEFLRLIPLLQEDFTVVAPSLPGYGLSFAPGQPRFGTEDMAEAFAELMTDVLGYPRYGCQGGDWGASISRVVPVSGPDGIHLNLL